MKRVALTCKDPGLFFRDCVGCKHYDNCDYFQKKKPKEVEHEKKKSNKQAN